MDYSPPGSSVHKDSPAKVLEWVAMPSSGGLPNSGIKPRFPTLQADSLPSESPPEGRVNGGPGPGLNHKGSRTLEKVQFSARQVWKIKVKVLVGQNAVTFKFLDPLEPMILQNVSSLPCASSLSHLQLPVIPWTVAHQAPLSMGFSRQEYWSGLPFPSPEAVFPIKG